MRSTLIGVWAALCFFASDTVASAEIFVLADPASPMTTTVDIKVKARDLFTSVDVLETEDSLADPGAKALLRARDDGILTPAWILEDFSFTFATLAGAGSVAPLGIPVEVSIDQISYRAFRLAGDMSGPTPENDTAVPPGRSFDALELDVHFVGILTIDGVASPFNHFEMIRCVSFGCFNPSPDVRWWAVSSPPLTASVATRVPMQSDVFEFDVVSRDGLTYSIEHHFQVDDVPFLVPEPDPYAAGIAAFFAIAWYSRRRR